MANGLNEELKKAEHAVENVEKELFDVGKKAAGKGGAFLKEFYGTFISNLINFVIMAFVVFMVIKQLNKFHKTEAPAIPTEKTCPYCKSSIALEATRCPHCTSELN